MLTDIHTHRLILSSGRAIYNVRLREGVDGLADLNTLFSVAVHPWDSDRDINWSILRQMVEDPRCLAIGETGLDKLHGPSFDIQIKVFEQQLCMAKEAGKPVIIHSVRAQQEVIAIIRKHKPLEAIVLHGFSQRPSVAQQWLNEGFCLSFGAALLNPNKALAESLRLTPPDRMFFETDDSITTIEGIYKSAAIILNIAPDLLMERVEQNFKEAFLHGKLV